MIISDIAFEKPFVLPVGSVETIILFKKIFLSFLFIIPFIISCKITSPEQFIIPSYSLIFKFNTTSYTYFSLFIYIFL